MKQTANETSLKEATLPAAQKDIAKTAKATGTAQQNNVTAKATYAAAPRTDATCTAPHTNTAPNAATPPYAHPQSASQQNTAPRAFWHALKIGDYVLFLVSLAVTACAFVLCYKPSTNGTLTVVADSPRGTWVYSLKTDTHATIHGSIGDTHLCIQDGTAYVTDSVCANKTCVLAGSISKTGEWIACMPNQVFIRIQGEEAPKTAASSAKTATQSAPTIDAFAQ